MSRKREYIAQVPAPPGGRHRRIVNQVRILNSSAAVSRESVFDMPLMINIYYLLSYRYEMDWIREGEYRR